MFSHRIDVLEIFLRFVGVLGLEVLKETKIEARKLKSGAAISRAIHQGSLSSGHYWAMWHDCSKEIQDEYLSHSQLPEKREKSTNKRVEKLHPINLQVLKFYNSVEDVFREYRISRANLYNAIKLGQIVKGFRWRFLE